MRKEKSCIEDHVMLQNKPVVYFSSWSTSAHPEFSTPRPSRRVRVVPVEAWRRRIGRSNSTRHLGGGFTDLRGAAPGRSDKTASSHGRCGRAGMVWPMFALFAVRCGQHILDMVMAPMCVWDLGFSSTSPYLQNKNRKERWWTFLFLFSRPSRL